MANIPTYSAQPVLSQEHERIHSKKGWTVTRKHAGIANAASSDIGFTTGANVYPHLRKFVVSATGGPCDAFLYEAATFSGGTALLTKNNCRPNKDLDALSGVTFVHTPTVSDLGDELDYALLPVLTSIGANIGGVTGADIGEEWILDPETSYILRMTNNSGGELIAGWHLFFYRED